MDAGEEIFIVDLRNRDEFEIWRVEGRKPIPTVNVPNFEVLGDSDADEVPQAFAEYDKKQWANTLPTAKFILVEGPLRDLVRKAGWPEEAEHLSVCHARAALNKVGLKVVACQLGQMMAEEIQNGGTGQHPSEELAETFLRLS